MKGKYIAGLLAACGAFAAGGYFFSPLLRAHAAAAGTMPYTLQANIDRFGETDSFLRVEVWTIASRSDGAHVTVEDTVNGRYSGTRIVSDPAVQRRTTVDVETKSLLTYRLAQKRQAAASSGPCGAGSDPAYKTVLGQTVVNRITRHTPGAENITLDEWVAPSLGCEVLESEQLVLENGARIGRNVIRATAITLGDPDPALFSIPEGYTERSPSEYLAERARVRGVACPECMQNSAAKLDQVYEGRRP